MSDVVRLYSGPLSTRGIKVECALQDIAPTPARWLSEPSGRARARWLLRMAAPLPGAAPRLLAWRPRAGSRPAVTTVIDRLFTHLPTHPRVNNRFVPAYLQSAAARIQ